MEHKRKKQWILIIVLLLTVCSVLAVYAGREWMFTNPFKHFQQCPMHPEMGMDVLM